MTEYEKMLTGMIYDPSDEEIMKEQDPYTNRLAEFNTYDRSDSDAFNKYIHEVFAECGENCWIEPPFHANWGGAHVHVGDNFYANFNLTLVDDGHIYIGDNVMFGPNVTIATANHPIDPELRRRALQYNMDVHIGNNVWIGAGAVIVPGVTIGDDSVIGALSVVTNDIPSGVVAVGNPCRIIREIGEHDRKYYYKDDEIDWGEI